MWSNKLGSVVLTFGEIVKGMSNRTSRGTDIMLTTDTCQIKPLSINFSEDEYS